MQSLILKKIQTEGDLAVMVYSHSYRLDSVEESAVCTLQENSFKSINEKKMLIIIHLAERGRVVVGHMQTVVTSEVVF